MEETIEELLVAINQGIELMRKCKHHMEIRGIDHLRPAFIYPEFLIDSLTIRAAAVPAGIIVEFNVPAVRTLGNAAAELTGFATEDVLGCFPLDIRENMPLGSEAVIRIVPDLLDLIHQKHPQSGRKDW